MCGIAGKVSARRAVPPELVERMCERLVHRGPDSRGTFLDDGAALGVQRLRVIDLETGDQPILNEHGDVAVVLNGEIYNYRELRRELSARHDFTTHSDTEVLVHLYEELGPGFVRRLRGMFALALWDARRRRLVLARDRLGKKPLFYADRGEELWFASELAAIVADPDIPRDVNWTAIDSYLRFAYVPHPDSGFAALRKLPPAHLGVWEDGTLRLERYWRLSYADRDLGSAAERRELVRSRLLEATSLRLQSDVPVGALLSGGVDSSSVVAAIARCDGTRPLRTFSIGFEDDEYDETPHARAVAAMYGADHHEQRVGPADVEALLPRIVRHHGEPFADSSSIATFRLAELAARHVTVVLNGDGGDECFAGYPRYARALRRLCDRGPVPLAARRYARHVVQLSQAELDGLYRREHVPRRDGGRWTAPLEGPLAGSDARQGVDRLLAADLHTYLPGDLMAKMDTATMAHGLEARSPFLDQVLVETAAALPASDKLDGTRSKALLKDAVADWLPPGLAERPKWGFSVPLAAWLRGPLRHLPDEVLLDPGSLERSPFRPERVRRIVAEHRLGAADHSDLLWSLIVLEQWRRDLVDRVPPPAPALVAA